MHSKIKIIASNQKLKSNNKTEFIKREIHIPLINGEWIKERREIWDFYRHKTGIVLIRVMTMYPSFTNWKGQKRNFYLKWICPELGDGNASMAYWIELSKRTLK